MRVWLIEQEGCGGTQTSLEPLLRTLTRQHPQGFSLAGVTGIVPDLAERTRPLQPLALVLNSVSWTQQPDAAPVLTLGLPVLIAGAWGSLDYWLRLAGEFSLGFVPVSAGQAELWAALQSLLAAHQREESLRSQLLRLNARLSDRIVIEKAKGVLMQRLGIGEDEAYKRLRVQSRRQRKQVREIAQSILDAQFIWEGNDVDAGLLAVGLQKPRRPRHPADDTAHLVEPGGE